jgi:hypothetical protein
MTKYRVFYSTTASTAVEVEADNEEQAIEKADQDVFVRLCHQCSGELDLSDSFDLDEVVVLP